MVDVGRDDRPPPGDFITHELSVHPLTNSDEIHLLGDFAPAGVVHLCDGSAGGAEREVAERLRHLDRRCGVDRAIRCGALDYAAPPLDPRRP